MVRSARVPSARAVAARDGAVHVAAGEILALARIAAAAVERAAVPEVLVVILVALVSGLDLFLAQSLSRGHEVAADVAWPDQRPEECRRGVVEAGVAG